MLNAKSPKYTLVWTTLSTQLILFTVKHFFYMFCDSKADDKKKNKKGLQNFLLILVIELQRVLKKTNYNI